MSKNHEEHHKYLQILFERLQHHRITINPTKYHFGKSSVIFLGYLIDENGTRPLPERVEVIREYPQPQTIMNLPIFRNNLIFIGVSSRRLLKHKHHLMNSYAELSARKNCAFRGHSKPHRFLIIVNNFLPSPHCSHTHEKEQISFLQLTLQTLQWAQY